MLIQLPEGTGKAVHELVVGLSPKWRCFDVFNDVDLCSAISYCSSTGLAEEKFTATAWCEGSSIRVEFVTLGWFQEEHLCNQVAYCYPPWKGKDISVRKDHLVFVRITPDGEDFREAIKGMSPEHAKASGLSKRDIVHRRATIRLIGEVGAAAIDDASTNHTKPQQRADDVGTAHVRLGNCAVGSFEGSRTEEWSPLMTMVKAADDVYLTDSTDSGDRSKDNKSKESGIPDSDIEEIEKQTPQIDDSDDWISNKTAASAIKLNTETLTNRRCKGQSINLGVDRFGIDDHGCYWRKKGNAHPKYFLPSMKEVTGHFQKILDEDLN